MLDKKIIFSGIQPSGKPHLGNYLGAIQNWAQLQDEYTCLYCIVDLHSLTVRQDANVLRENSRNLLTLLIAAGLDPDKCVLYFQSNVSAHCELAWILNCYTYMGELNRMTQFKEKSQKHEENVNAGLFTYPVLMAADILLFGSHLVPVGEDQRQHLEICRDIAIRFNKIYGDIFTVPEAYIGKTGARVMSLGAPEKKMSKSDSASENDIVYLLDDEKTILNKFKKAVTDSQNTVRLSEDKPGIANLIGIYSAVTGISPEQTEQKFKNAGYGEFKTAVAEAVITKTAPIRDKYAKLTADKAYIDAVIKQGAEKAADMAEVIIKRTKIALGLL